MCLKFTGSNSDGGLFTIQGLSFAVSIYFGTFLSSETFFPGFVVSYISQFVIGGFGFNAWDFVFVKCLVDSNDNCMFKLIAVHKAAENPKRQKNYF